MESMMVFPYRGEASCPRFYLGGVGGDSKHPQWLWSKGEFQSSQTIILICLTICVHSEVEVSKKNWFQKKKK